MLNNWRCVAKPKKQHQNASHEQHQTTINDQSVSPEQTQSNMTITELEHEKLC